MPMRALSPEMPLCRTTSRKTTPTYLDSKVRQTIDEAIQAIEAIQDFENTAKNNPQVKAAIDKVAELEEILDKEVLPLLSK